METTSQINGPTSNMSDSSSKLLEFLQSCRFRKDEALQFLELFQKNKVDLDLLLQLYEEDALLVDLLKNQLSLLPGDLIRIKLGIKAIHARGKTENAFQPNLRSDESPSRDSQRSIRTGNPPSSRTKAAPSPEKQSKELPDKNSKRNKTSEYVAPLEGDQEQKRLGTTSKNKLSTAAAEVEEEPPQKKRKSEKQVEKKLYSDDAWNRLHHQLLRYKKENKHLCVPRTYSELGDFVRQMRLLKRTGKMPTEQFEKLDEIGFLWDFQDLSLFGKNWDYFFERAKKFHETNKHWNIPESDDELFTWVSTVKFLRFTKNGLTKLSDDRVAQLEKIGFDFARNSNMGETIGVSPKKAKKEETDDETEDVFKEEETSDVEETENKSPSKKKAIIQERWESRVKDLLRFKELHGNCEVPLPGDKRLPAEFVQLGWWVKNVRYFRMKGKLSKERIRILDDLGFVWKSGSSPKSKQDNEFQAEVRERKPSIGISKIRNKKSLLEEDDPPKPTLIDSQTKENKDVTVELIPDSDFMIAECMEPFPASPKKLLETEEEEQTLELRTLRKPHNRKRGRASRNKKSSKKRAHIPVAIEVKSKEEAIDLEELCAKFEDAIVNGDVSFVKKCLTNGSIKVTTRIGHDKVTPLHVACENGQKEITQLLVDEYGSNMYASGDDYGGSPMHYACFRGHLPIVKYFIEKKKFEINFVDKLGSTPAHDAASGCQLEILKYFIEHHKVSPLQETNRQNSNRSMIHLAANSENISEHKIATLKYLIEDRGVHVDLKDSSECTPLTYAVRMGDVPSIKYLRSKGASLNQKSRNFEIDTANPVDLLQEACFYGQLEAAKFLIQQDANLFDPKKDLDEQSCFTLAVISENIELVKYLLAIGVSPNVKGIRPSLWYACRDGSLEMVKLLVEEAGLNPMDYSEPRTLKRVAKNKEVKDYIRSFYDPKTSQLMELLSAAENGDLAKVKELIEQKQMSPQACNSQGSTALHAACAGGKLEVVKYLIAERHCDVNIRTKRASNMTPLHTAAWYQQMEVVKYLIQSKADVHAKGGSGEEWNVLDYAKDPVNTKQPNSDLIAYLKLQYGNKNC